MSLESVVKKDKRSFWSKVSLAAFSALTALGLYDSVPNARSDEEPRNNPVQFASPTPSASSAPVIPQDDKKHIAYITVAYRFDADEGKSSLHASLFVNGTPFIGSKDSASKFSIANALDAEDGSIDQVIKNGGRFFEPVRKFWNIGGIMDENRSPFFKHSEKYVFESQADRDSFVQKLGNLDLGRPVIIAFSRDYVGSDGVFQSAEVESFLKYVTGLRKSTIRPIHAFSRIEKGEDFVADKSFEWSVPGVSEETFPVYVTAIIECGENPRLMKEARAKFGALVAAYDLTEPLELLDAANNLDALDGVSDDSITMANLDYRIANVPADKRDVLKALLPTFTSSTDAMDVVLKESDASFIYSEKFVCKTAKDRDFLLRLFRDTKTSRGKLVRLAHDYVGSDGVFQSEELNPFGMKAMFGLSPFDKHEFYKSRFVSSVAETEEDFSRNNSSRVNGVRTYHYLKIVGNYDFVDESGKPSVAAFEIFDKYAKHRGLFGTAELDYLRDLDGRDGLFDGVISKKFVDARLGHLDFKVQGNRSGNNNSTLLASREYFFYNRQMRDTWANSLKGQGVSATSLVWLFDNRTYYFTDEGLKAFTGDVAKLKALPGYSVKELNGTITP